MKPEQAMQIYLAECAVHAAVLDEGLANAKQWMPLSNATQLDKELLLGVPMASKGEEECTRE